MTREESIFLWVLILNVFIAALYLLYGCLVHTKGRESAQRLTYYVLRSVCMILCPVIGALYFGMTGLFRKVFFHREEDIGAIEFDKARIRQLTGANEGEQDLLPIQEALLVSTPSELRKLVLTVLKKEDLFCFRTVALAASSEDSETAHYAGSLLSKELNMIRSSIKRQEQELRDTEKDGQRNMIEQHNRAVQFVRETDFLLQQHVLSQMEQEMMTKEMAHAGELALQIEQERKGEEAVFSLALGAPEYAGIAMRLIDIQAYEDASIWCGRMMETFPEETESYKCLLRLKYQTGDSQGFLETIARLKRSRIRIDKELMGMIRLFNTR